MRIKRTLALLAVLSTAACAQQNAPLLEQFKAQYPNTHFSEVRLSPISGLVEVVMGENIAYADSTGRYFLFGHLFDMPTQTDLTAHARLKARKIAFPAPFLANAIKTVQGDGSRVLAIFSDPDCPYCKQLEGELAHLSNVTIYTFLYPLESLHPDAKSKAIRVWCAPDQAKAWYALMRAGQKPKIAACSNPVDDNLDLGSRLGVVGTPTLIAADGRVLSGAASAQKIDQWLDAKRISAHPAKRKMKP